MKNRKKVVWIILAGILAICAAAPSIAFVTRQAETENRITFGDVHIQLKETTLGEDGKEILFDESQETDITSNGTCSRIIRVENTGSQPVWIRVSLSMSGQKENGEITEANNFVSYDINNKDWVYKDGWYYYKHEVTADMTTNALMTEVIFNDINAITDEFPGGKFKLEVQSQGVQSKNNEAEDVLAVKGWPEE